MASSLEYVEYVCDIASACGAVRSKFMFGDYLIYVDELPLLLLGNNVTYIKQFPGIAAEMQAAETAIPYPGAKLRYILDVENVDLCRRVISKILQIEKNAPCHPRKKPKNL